MEGFDGSSARQGESDLDSFLPEDVYLAAAKSAFVGSDRKERLDRVICQRTMWSVLSVLEIIVNDARASRTQSAS